MLGSRHGNIEPLTVTEKIVRVHSHTRHDHDVLLLTLETVDGVHASRNVLRNAKRMNPGMKKRPARENALNYFISFSLWLMPPF